MSRGRGWQGRRRAATDGQARPQLTSLVDMMVILLVFLLQTFSVQGQLVTPSRDLYLPSSSATEPAEPMRTVTITTGGVGVDGRQVTTLAAIAAEPDSLLVAPLMAALRDMPGDPGPVSIQCDRRVDFALLKRVLYTCNRAGHGDLSLLVLREGS